MPAMNPIPTRIKLSVIIIYNMAPLVAPQARRTASSDIRFWMPDSLNVIMLIAGINNSQKMMILTPTNKPLLP